MEYVNTGQATVQNSCIHLPNGQPIPNDGSGRGLKHGIDTWLSANSATPEATTVPAQSSKPIPFQHDIPPHATLSFEAIRSEVHMAQISNATDIEDPTSKDNSDGELYDLFEVLATEKAD